jgi:hypothetical protein
MSAGGVDGIPKGSLYAANLLTDAGVQGSAKRFQGRQAFDEGRAAYAVNLNLRQSASHPFPMNNNPTSRALARTYYSAGLGDDDMNANLQASPAAAAAAIASQGWGPIVYNAPTAAVAAPDPGGSSSGWMNVLNTSSVANLFSGIGSGLSRLVGGNVAPTTYIAPVSSSPSLTTMLLIGGALAVPLYLFMRKK